MSAGDQEFWHHKVLIGLLAHPDADTRRRIERAYENNADFHAGIKVLARALPEFIKIMADQAEEQENLRERAMERLMNEPFPPFAPH